MFEFDAVNQTTGNKLAYYIANAEDYQSLSSIWNVPISTFDMSSFQVNLDSSQTYGLAVFPMDSFGGGMLSLQAATDIYPGGHSFRLVPEPATLLLLCIGGLTLCRRKA